MRPTEKIIKTYPQKGPLSQYRFEKSVPFNCFRCKTLKTSKLISIFSDDWEIKLCNGCYGLLLSLYENYQDIILEEDKETHKNIIQKDSTILIIPMICFPWPFVFTKFASLIDKK